MSEKINNWINGVETTPLTGEYRTALNPATGQAGNEVAASGQTDVDAAVSAAVAAAKGWRNFASADRGRLLYRIAEGIRAEAEQLADLEISETGKPRGTALGEVETSAAYFEFYAGLVNMPQGDVLDVEPNQHVFTKREPFGVIGAITPWNVPMNQAARAIAPALVSGNVVVLKPAETSSRTSFELARIASEAGLPAGVLNVVMGSGSIAGSAIVEHPAVRKVVFTGSVETGRKIGRIAAERIIPLTLELGGKSANIVFADADLDLAARESVRAFSANTGQVCSAGTRLLVERSVHDEFVRKVAEIASKLKVGEDYGAIITRDQYTQVLDYFEVAKSEGVELLTGGKKLDDASREGGFYVQPTVYGGVSNDMRIAREEIFGPVVVAIPFDTEDEAIEIANDSDYGLVGGVFTNNIGRALRVADSIEAGQIFVNSWSTGAVQTPFGGHKDSGYGREKGIEAINHYTHLKTVVVVY